MRLVLALAVLLAATSACSGLGEDSGKVRVAAGFYPLAWAAQRVGGNLVEVTNLTQPGAEPHDLELTIKETVEIARADVVVYEKGFQPAVDEGVSQTAEGATLDAASVARLQPYEQGSGTDPHFWQDPVRLADVGDALAAALGRADPAHRSAYDTNAARLRRDLTGLDHAYAAGLADCERETIVTSHEAFGYLSKYGLHVEPITGLSPDAEPTPGDLERLQELIRDKGITTVFSEALVSPKTAETLASDLGIRARVLDPVEGLSDATSDEDYLSLMRSNLSTLEQANGCR